MSKKSDAAHRAADREEEREEERVERLAEDRQASKELAAAKAAPPPPAPVIPPVAPPPDKVVYVRVRNKSAIPYGYYGEGKFAVGEEFEVPKHMVSERWMEIV